MRRILGPILGFRGADDAAWRVGVLAVFQGDGDPPALAWRHAGGDGDPVPGTALREHRGRRAVRYEIAVPRTAAEQTVRYGFGDETWRFQVPAAGTSPRTAFTSCNGYSHPKYLRDVEVLNERWIHLKEAHDEAPLNLLVMGGDQIYADSIWMKVPALERWNDLPTKERVKKPFTDAMRAAVERFYFDLYCGRWSQPEVASVWASIPTLMTWDDHDIFDGWGSYDTDLQRSHVYRGIFEVAREHFRVFQLQLAPGEDPPGAVPGRAGLSSGHRLGDLAILLVDTRSERSLDTVVSQEGWDAIFAWIDALRDVRHLLVVTAVPVAYPAVRPLEWIAGLDPRHEHKRLVDDLRDHWTSPAHVGERKRLVHRLFGFSRKQSCRVTVLSGDVHVAALGVLESRRDGQGGHADVINQLVSSPVVHPAPGGAVRWALDKLAALEQEVDRGIRVRMLDVPGSGQRVVNARNWLELEWDDARRLWANWHFEDDASRYTKVIHPVGWDAQDA